MYVTCTRLFIHVWAAFNNLTQNPHNFLPLEAKDRPLGDRWNKQLLAQTSAGLVSTVALERPRRVDARRAVLTRRLCAFVDVILTDVACTTQRQWA